MDPGAQGRGRDRLLPIDQLKRRTIGTLGDCWTLQPFVRVSRTASYVADLTPDDVRVSSRVSARADHGVTTRFSSSRTVYLRSAASAQDVAARTREVGIRLALGSPPGRVTALVVRDVMRVCVPGAAVGMVLAYAATRVMEAGAGRFSRRSDHVCVDPAPAPRCGDPCLLSTGEALGPNEPADRGSI
jgi:hypothetical protein